MKQPPVTLHVPRWFLRRPRPLAHVLARALGLSLHDAWPLSVPFELKNDELSFLRLLLRRRGNFHAWRCNQQRFCGDFVLVDLSSPDPALRAAWVVDLKQHGALRVGGGGAGNQLTQASLAVESLCDKEGPLVSGCAYEILSGDREAILAYLGAPSP